MAAITDIRSSPREKYSAKSNAPQGRRKANPLPLYCVEGAQEVLKLMHKYADVPMSFADACLVRMTEGLCPSPCSLTTDAIFRVYRRLGRKTIPCMLPR